jgi:hypothetical protein
LKTFTVEIPDTDELALKVSAAVSTIPVKVTGSVELLFVTCNCNTVTPAVPGIWVEFTGATAAATATAGWIGVKVGVTVGVEVGVAVGVKVGVPVGVEVGVKVGVGVRVEVVVDVNVDVLVEVNTGVTVAAKTVWVRPLIVVPNGESATWLTCAKAPISEGAIRSEKVPPFWEFKSNTNNRVWGAPGVTDRLVRFEKAALPAVKPANVAKGVGGVVPLNKPFDALTPVSGKSLTLETSVFEFRVPPAVKVTAATDTGWLPVAESTIWRLVAFAWLNK